ncbi:MAG: hypothetical protein KJ000_26985 [Pirellulaceae bacterium]|nr:hypothetical protein [Pirellulaceae bacterium]
MILTTTFLDWSLPPSGNAVSGSGVLISPKRVLADFPCSIVKSVVGTWREIEPREGEYDFSRFRQAILDARGVGCGNPDGADRQTDRRAECSLNDFARLVGDAGRRQRSPVSLSAG